MPLPASYPSLTPAIAVADAAKAIEFYKNAFDAVELYRLVDPENGRVGHAEITIGGQLMMIADEYPAFNKSATTLGGSATKFVLMVPNADAAFAKAIAVGATEVRAPQDQFYGFRAGTLRDPFGHEWMLQHEFEKVSPEEMQQRWNGMMKKCD
ncbi:MAG: hypothetical protein JWO89_2033 [Verrucomicrobiaceae bacterium]|nr:hypothetical protein [Verrucomicrobiaceae bacterium]